MDRGLAYGDGHFTTLLVKDGHPVWWPAHLARLQQASARLGLAELDWQQLGDEVAGMARDQTLAVIKVMLTRGSGGRGMMAPPAMHRPGSCRWLLTRLTTRRGSKPVFHCWCASNDWAMPPCWRASRPSTGWSRCC